MGIISKLSKLAIKKSKGPVSKGGKSRWLTSGTSENKKRLEAEGKFRNQIKADIKKSNEMSHPSTPKIDEQTLLDDKGKKAWGDLEKTGWGDFSSGTRKYTKKQEKAYNQLQTSFGKSYEKLKVLRTSDVAPVPMNRLTDQRVLKHTSTSKRSRKEQIVIDQAKTNPSRVLSQKKTRKNRVSSKLPDVKYTEPAKPWVSPAGTEHIRGSKINNPFAQGNAATGDSKKIIKRMEAYQEHTRLKKEAMKAREELKSATSEQLSAAHAPKVEPSTVKRKETKPPSNASDRFQKLLTDSGKTVYTGSITRTADAVNRGIKLPLTEHKPTNKYKKKKKK